MKRSLIWVAVAVVALSALSAVAEAAKPAGTVYVDDDSRCAGLKPCFRTIPRGGGLGVTLTVTAAGATLDHLDVVGGFGAGVLVLADTVALQFLDVSGTSGDGIAVTGTSILPLAGEAVPSSAAPYNPG